MNEVKAMVDAAVKVPGEIFKEYLSWLVEQGLSAVEIREALAVLGYGWC